MPEPPSQPITTPELLSPVEIYVAPPVRRRYWWHALLLITTVFTTLVVGARLQFNFDHELPAIYLGNGALPVFPLRWVIGDPSRLLLGVPFSATLMFILLAHEMGHLVYCVRHGVRATLPYFIPAPTLIGTLGAFIRIRSIIRSRTALFDIGIAGPIAGFIPALVASAVGLLLSRPLPSGAMQADIEFGFPPVFHLINSAMSAVTGSDPVDLTSVYLHPVGIAAWVGMFATALNLLPGGQLDGGHIVYALSPRAHRWVSRTTVLILLPMAIVGWAGWLIWGALLWISGMRHPRVPVEPAPRANRYLVGLVGAAMLAFTFTPTPFPGSALLDLFR